nr:hypothetical protein [Actinacidiphila paucisporea]
MTPKYPQAPAVPTLVAPEQHTPACQCQHPQPLTATRRTAPGFRIAAGAVAAAITVGIVLTALLVAVTVAAVSVAGVAVVLRSLLTPPRQR